MNKLRILFLHYELVCGGAEQALFDLISLLDKSRFDVTVMVQCDGGIWEPKFRNAGIRVVSIWDNQKSSHNPLIKAQNLFKRRRIQKSINNDGENLAHIALNQQFDIIVSYKISLQNLSGFQKNAKSVKFIHGDMNTNPDFANSIREEQALLNRFDRIICVSEAARQSFIAQTGVTDNVTAHYNPLNSDNVKKLSSTKVMFPQDAPMICAVGRLAAEKGYSRLIEIHKKLLDEGIFHRLVIVGDGPERENLENKIKNLQVEDTVILAGYSSNPYPYMKQSKFVVCSSFTEGLPVIAMESLCLGIPIVSAVPSIGEIFGDSECGLITENDDESLANGIRCLLTDPVLYQKTKAAAQERSKFFDGKRMVKEIEDEFIALANQ